MRKNLFWTLTALAACLGGAALAGAATLEVPATYSTIQAAIDAAADGDEILVAPGTYTETLDIFDLSDLTLRGSGGAAGTTIDADSTGSAIEISASPGTTIEGFTVTGGSASGGAGIAIESSSSTTVRACIVSGNVAAGVGEGGGLRVEGSDDVEIADSVIDGNTAEVGGGVYATGSTLDIENSEITGNTASGDGGGLYVDGLFTFGTELSGSTIGGNSAANGGGAYSDGGGLRLLDTTVTGNSATTQGGGLYLTGGLFTEVTGGSVSGNDADEGGGAYVGSVTVQVLLRSCLVTDNLASGGRGGGLLLEDLFAAGSSRVIIDGCTFANNEAEEGGALYVLDSTVSAGNSIFWSDTADFGPEMVVEGDIEDAEVVVEVSNLIESNVLELGTGELDYGAGNLDEDPLFVDEAGGDYHLTATSPCIDAGAVGLLTPDEDYEMDTRNTDGDGDGAAFPDMGADEVCPFLPGDADASGTVSIVDGLNVLDYLFNGGPAPSPVLAVADVNGDGSVSIADAQRILAYLFSSGPRLICRP